MGTMVFAALLGILESTNNDLCHAFGINDGINDGINGINGYKLSSIESAIIGCLEKNPTISMKEIALNTGAGERTVARYIKILKEHGIIEIQGRTKSKRWIVK